jgi:hypothetical protein
VSSFAAVEARAAAWDLKTPKTNRPAALVLWVAMGVTAALRRLSMHIWSEQWVFISFVLRAITLYRAVTLYRAISSPTTRVASLVVGSVYSTSKALQPSQAFY